MPRLLLFILKQDYNKIKSKVNFDKNNRRESKGQFFADMTECVQGKQRSFCVDYRFIIDKN
jgi:hypothetical protein